MIRPYSVGLAHAEVLHALNEDCFERPWSREAIAQTLSLPGGLAWLADFAGKPVGFACATVQGEEAELLLLGVLAQARGRGLARTLLQTVLYEAEARGARVMFLEVAADNLPAQALYRAEGFSLLHRRRAYYSDGRDALVLRAFLQPGPSAGLAPSGCA